MSDIIKNSITAHTIRINISFLKPMSLRIMQIDFDGSFKALTLGGGFTVQQFDFKYLGGFNLKDNMRIFSLIVLKSGLHYYQINNM